MIKITTPDTIWTDMCGIYRWDSMFSTRPGTYRVVATSNAYDLIRLGQKQVAGWDHPTCVVDDFGNLVAVPA